MLHKSNIGHFGLRRTVSKKFKIEFCLVTFTTARWIIHWSSPLLPKNGHIINPNPNTRLSNIVIYTNRMFECQLCRPYPDRGFILVLLCISSQWIKLYHTFDAVQSLLKRFWLLISLYVELNYLNKRHLVPFFFHLLTWPIWACYSYTKGRWIIRHLRPWCNLQTETYFLAVNRPNNWRLRVQIVSYPNPNILRHLPPAKTSGLISLF